MPRFYCHAKLVSGELLNLPPGAARHVQVLRLQPGDTITLFSGGPGETGIAGEFGATITRMGRSEVEVKLGEHHPVQREARLRVQLAIGMPANERMDWLVEKATELGVASIQPLMTERSVLRLSDERAGKKIAHWQSIAIAACEQCGGNQVPLIHEVMSYAAWLKARAASKPLPTERALLLSLREGTVALRQTLLSCDSAFSAITLLSGPEGGLSNTEEEAAVALGFKPVTLGPRVLRAETAALTALAGLLL